MQEGQLFLPEVISDGLVELVSVKEVIARRVSGYQEIIVADTVPFGRCLFIDGKLQSSLLDEHIYHEVLVHPSMVIHGEPKDVLIIGGGEGATLREVLRWNSVKSAEMVDIDAEVIEVCAKHLPELSAGSFDDPRARVVIDDGRKVLEGLPKGSLDVIVIDATDPTEGAQSLRLYSREFYSLAFSRLKERGILVTQATSVVHTPFAYCSIFSTISEVFGSVIPMAAFIPSFSSVWGFVIGAKGVDCLDLSPREIDDVLSRNGVRGLKFYDGSLHGSLISLARKYLELRPFEGKIITDSEPVKVP